MPPKAAVRSTSPVRPIAARPRVGPKPTCSDYIILAGAQGFSSGLKAGWAAGTKAGEFDGAKASGTFFK